MTGYYDREGREISTTEWARLWELPGYRRIAHTTLPDGRFVSTVWLGSNYQFGHGPPLIFETMVFSAKTHEISIMPSEKFHESLGTWRYSTEVQARAGHEQVVAELRGRVTVEELVDGTQRSSNG